VAGGAGAKDAPIYTIANSSRACERIWGVRGGIASSLSQRPPLSMSGSSRRERELVRATRRGSQEATDALVRQYWPDLYRTAFLISGDRSAAEDIAQDAMLAALDRLDDFDVRRRLAPWLHRIVANRSIDWVRIQRRQYELAKRVAHGSDQREDVGVGLPGSLAEALDALAELDRAIVVLRHLFEYRSSEIGELLDLPAGTVRRRLQEALAQLKHELGKETRDHA
jgi:RNA polymerase sigma-70 factor, ECF subfamily